MMARRKNASHGRRPEYGHWDQIKIAPLYIDYRLAMVTRQSMCRWQLDERTKDAQR
jgi:hypothetical protein